MQYKSQICTTKEQSERLLELGLKPETADCCLDDVIEGIYSPMALKKVFESQIPAWSLHRLIELCPESINIDDYAFLSCKGLEIIIFGVGLNRIGRSAFYGCSSLTDIALILIPSMYTLIGVAH